MRKLCFVDDNLKVVDDINKAVAIVNVRKDLWVEIVFFKPIASDVTYKETKSEGLFWKQRFYPKYMNSVPSLETCEFFNKFLPEDKKFKNAFMFKPLDHELGRMPKMLYYLDNVGGVALTSAYYKKVSNAYVSILMHQVTFRKLNRFIDLAYSYKVSLHKDLV